MWLRPTGVDPKLWARSNSGSKCPYCGKRLKYTSALYPSGRYEVCRKCGREMPWAGLPSRSSEALAKWAAKANEPEVPPRPDVGHP